MVYPPIVITAPSEAALSIEEVKLFLRIDGDELDTEIAMHIAASIADAQQIAGIRIGSQTVDIGADQFADLAHPGIGPITAIISISYEDVAGDTQIVPAEAYRLIGGDLDPGIRLNAGASWPMKRAIDRAITVRATAGYDDSALPADLRRALLLDIRGRFDGVPADLPSMLVNHRIWL